jgi:hypothetical protein
LSPGEQPAPTGAPVKSFTGGAVVGGLMALVMAGLLLISFIDEHYFFYLLILAVIVLGPLLLLNLVFFAVYLKRRAPARAYWLMWGPPFGVLAGLWPFISGQQISDKLFERAHPNIREVHVNLSGHSLWLDPESTVNDAKGAGELPGNQPGHFASFTRYAQTYYGKDRMLAYSGSRLAADFTSQRVFPGEPAETAALLRPVVLAAPYPDLARFLSRERISPQDEAGFLVYLYYHYADRVEVAPALRLAGSQAMDLWGQPLPVVSFHLANLRALPLARLEIDGQAIDLGDAAFASESAEGNGCVYRNYEAHAVNALSRPLKVRWQFAQPATPWHEAVVSVPQFDPARRPKGSAQTINVELYFQDDDSVVAERSLAFDQAQQKFALWTTGPAPSLRRPAPCGTAADRYREDAEVILDRPQSGAFRLH